MVEGGTKKVKGSDSIRREGEEEDVDCEAY